MGEECNLEGYIVHFGHRVGGMYIFGLCISWIDIFVLDITCQHLGDECNLEGFLVPFGHRVGGMTNFWNMCKLAKYMFVLDIYCKLFGDESKLHMFELFIEFIGEH